MQTENGSPPEEVVPVEFKFEGMTISSEEDILFYNECFSQLCGAFGKKKTVIWR